MMLQLPEAQSDQLRETADRLGMAPEELLRVWVDYLFIHPDKELADLVQTQQTRAADNHVDDGSTEASSVAQLERRRRALSAMALDDRPPRAKGDAWRNQVGIFADDPLMDGIFESGRQWREADRNQSSE
jgi:hypothetical protein